jgi:predicted nucleotidyltransferase
MAAPEQKEKLKGIEFYGGYEVYSESGIDLTLLRGNLRRSIEERWEKNRRATEAGLALWQSNPHRELLAGTSFERSPIVSDVEAFVKLLTAQNVQFVIIGGQAMRALGSAHLTEDTDICYQRTPANLATLVAALAPIHPYLRGVPPGLPFRFDVLTLEAGLNFTFDTDYGELDLLGEVRGVGNYDQVLAQSVERTVYGLPVRILSVDGLIAAKKAAGRNKDQSHLLELIELKKILDAAKPAEEKP